MQSLFWFAADSVQTTLLRALAEQHWTIWLECPYVPRSNPAVGPSGAEVGETKSGVRSLRYMLDRMGPPGAAGRTTEVCEGLFRRCYAATMLIFLMLYHVGKFKTPREWLYLQLHYGGASLITGISPVANLRVLTTGKQPCSIDLSV
jgi:hypothetical protein